jgi:hypothetical protein
MPSTDNNPKINDHIDRDPTNEEIVDHLKRGLVMRICPILDKRIGQHLTTFEFRTNFEGAQYHFDGTWLDGTGTKVLAGATNKEYTRAKALASLLDDKCFPSVEAWVVACRNALGDNIDTFPLAGAIFVEGQCVDELLDAREDKVSVEPVQEPVALFADDKTDGKQPASPADDKERDKSDKRLEDAQVSQQYLLFFCEQHQPKMQAVSS